MTELLPCPFCNGSTHLADTGVHWVVCNSCSAEGPVTDTEQDAIAKWNSRTASRDLAAGTWQPIETAPKDGTWVLVWENHGINTKFSPADVGRYHLGEWQNGDKTRLHNASHWMPLPTAPGASVASAQGARRPIELINARLEDLEGANALYGKDQRLDAPLKVERNNREISWLKDLRSEVTLALSAHTEGDPGGDFADRYLAARQRLTKDTLSEVIERNGLDGKFYRGTGESDVEFCRRVIATYLALSSTQLSGQEG